jgi:phosphoribosylformylglycinamidine synthase
MVQPLPNDPPVNEALLRSHKVSASEYERILGALGREPTFTELGVFSVMWSEHCSYKSSRLHLRRLPTKGPKVIQGPGENAGVVDIGDGLAAVFKMESHNHPSFIEPHQGAATGVGGIMRDVFTMGARPIASLNSLRFGHPGHPRTPELLRGVVEGIGGYGNCIGVPTVGGEVQFDARYDGNILVNAFTCGLARTDRIFYGRATGIGYSILYIGAKTGRDGIHGATMASDEFSNEGPSQRPTMQVGDPFMGKLLLEACLELFSQDILEGIQDMGAAGLTSSSVEMAGRAKNGIEIDLDKVPRRARNMQPYELLLSESQERMLLVAKPGKESRVLEICKKWELDAAIIGKVTSSGRWVVRATPGFDPLDPRGASPQSVVVADIPIDALTDDAPVYDRPCAEPKAPASLGPMPAFLEGRDLVATILAHVASPNLGSRQWIWRQFDSIVRGGTLVGPGSDAAVVHVRAEGKDNQVYDKWLAFAVDCNGRYCELNAREGAKMAIAEVCRNLVCSGAEPIGITDCLNFGNPEKPSVMASFRDAVDGLAEACVALGVPIVSGNVSLYNETDGQAILPTPTVAAVGQIHRPEHITRAYFRPDQRDTILLLGEYTTALHFAGSEYACARVGLRGELLPIDLAFERKLQRLLRTLIVQQLVESAHDVSDGGLVNALVESCCGSTKSSAGAIVSLPFAGDALQAALFAEGPSRILLSVHDERVSRVSDLAREAGVPVQVMGVVSGDGLCISGSTATWSMSLSDLRSAREGCLASIVGGGP